MNTLNDLAETILGTHGYEGNMHTNANGVERLFLNDKKYSKYIEEKDGEFVLKVFLKSIKFGTPSTKEQMNECFSVRDSLIEELNTLGLGVEITSGFKGAK